MAKIRVSFSLTEEGESYSEHVGDIHMTEQQAPCVDSNSRKLWREDYGARFSVFDPEDQHAPELDSWNPDMWEPYNPKPGQDGNYDPGIIKHLRWFSETREFLQARYQLVIGPDLFFDCRAMKCQRRFSEEVDSRKERLW
jgi:hypothetical protein